MNIKLEKIHKLILIIFGINLLLISISVDAHINYSTSLQRPNFELNTNYSIHAPIIIGSDADLLLLNLSGSGTPDAPLLLQNFNLTSNTSNLIIISNTSLSLRIQHNFLNGINNQFDGIVLQDVRNIRIVNNTIIQTDIGIHLNSSSNNIIGYNSISGNSGYAIKLQKESNLNLIVWNDILQNTLTTSNAYDDGLQNVFQNNFWEVQIKLDLDDNQINDQPYDIAGDIVNSDLTPLTNEFDQSIHRSSQIHLLQPNPSEVRIGLAKILWTPSLDSHGHSVNYSLFYSSNSNPSWILIKDQLKVNYFDWIINGISEGQYSLKIQVIEELIITSEYIFDYSFYIGNTQSNITDINGSEVSESAFQGFRLPLLIFFAILFIALGIYQFIKRILNRSLSKKVLEGLLGITATPVLLQIISGDKTETERFEIVPPELLKFKFLLNPVRLGIMKILYDYSQIAAYELRDLIGISWGKFTPHIDSLINKGLISSSNDFIDGKPRKIIFIEEVGRGQFMELQLILRKIAN